MTEPQEPQQPLSREQIYALVAQAIVTSRTPLAAGSAAALDAAVRAGPCGLPVVHADQLNHLPPLRWIQSTEIPANSLAILYGPSGSGKSFVALDYSLRIAQQEPVLYVAAEGVEGYAARKIAWCRFHGLGAGHLHFVPQAVNLLDPTGVELLIAACDQVQPVRPVMIVIDTLARCMVGGDENTARDMGLLVAGCDRVREATGATILLVHHTGKSGLSERGSSALRAAASQMLELGDDDEILTLSCDKAKDSGSLASHSFRLLIIVTERTNADGLAETSCVLVPAEKGLKASRVSPSGRKLLETLSLETFAQTGARSNVLQSVVSLKTQTLYKALSALMRDGYVTQAQKGDPFYITEKGLLFVKPTLPTLLSL